MPKCEPGKVIQKCKGCDHKMLGAYLVNGLCQACRDG